MTATSNASGGAAAPIAPTEYFYYSPSVGEPGFFVMADLEYPASKEKYLNEYRAYEGLRGARPRPLDPLHLPKKITLHKKRTIPPIFCTVDGLVVLDSTVRSAIETLEPERHQFIPVKVFHRSGEEEPRKFFLLNVYHVVEALAQEEMGVEHKTAHDGQPFLALPMRALREVKLRRDALDGAGHLFCDPRCQPPGNIWIISKEMVVAIQEAKGRLSELTHCKVIG